MGDRMDNVKKSFKYIAAAEMNEVGYDIKERKEDLNAGIRKMKKDYTGTNGILKSTKEAMIKMSYFKEISLASKSIFEHARKGNIYLPDEELNGGTGNEGMVDMGGYDDMFADVEFEDDGGSDVSDDTSDGDDEDLGMGERAPVDRDVTVKQIIQSGQSIPVDRNVDPYGPSQANADSIIHAQQALHIDTISKISAFKDMVDSKTDTLNQNLSIIAEFQNTVQKPFYSTALKFFEDSALMINSIKGSLLRAFPEKHIQSTVKKPQGISEMLDSSNYKGAGAQIKQKGLAGIMQSLGGVGMGMQAFNAMKMMFDMNKDNPLNFLKMGVTGAINSKTGYKDTLEKVNKIVKSPGKAFNEAAKTMALSDNKLIAGAGNELVEKNSAFQEGIKAKSAKATEVMQWNKRSDKALVEIIPAYLSKITAAVTKTEREIYNYDTGKYRTVKEIKKDFDGYNPEAKIAQSGKQLARSLTQNNTSGVDIQNGELFEHNVSMVAQQLAYQGFHVGDIPRMKYKQFISKTGLNHINEKEFILMKSVIGSVANTEQGKDLFETSNDSLLNAIKSANTFYATQSENASSTGLSALMDGSVKGTDIRNQTKVQAKTFDKGLYTGDKEYYKASSMFDTRAIGDDKYAKMKAASDKLGSANHFDGKLKNFFDHKGIFGKLGISEKEKVKEWLENDPYSVQSLVEAGSKTSYGSILEHIKVTNPDLIKRLEGFGVDSKKLYETAKEKGRLAKTKAMDAASHVESAGMFSNPTGTDDASKKDGDDFGKGFSQSEASDIFNGDMTGGTGYGTGYFYSQNDSKFKNIKIGDRSSLGVAGCAIFSAAMAISNILDESIGPENFIELGRKHKVSNDGIDFGFFKESADKYDIFSNIQSKESINVKGLKAILKKGHQIVAMIENAPGSKHYVTLTGIRGRKIKVSDPLNGESKVTVNKLYGKATQFIVFYIKKSSRLRGIVNFASKALKIGKTVATKILSKIPGMGLLAGGLAMAHRKVSGTAVGKWSSTKLKTLKDTATYVKFKDGAYKKNIMDKYITVKSKGSEMYDTSKSKGSELYDTAKSKGSELYDTAKSKVKENQKISKLKDTGKDLLDKSKEKLGTLKTNAKETLKKQKEKVKVLKKIDDDRGKTQNELLESLLDGVAPNIDDIKMILLKKEGVKPISLLSKVRRKSKSLINKLNPFNLMRSLFGKGKDALKKGKGLLHKLNPFSSISKVVRKGKSTLKNPFKSLSGWRNKRSEALLAKRNLKAEKKLERDASKVKKRLLKDEKKKIKKDLRADKRLAKKERKLEKRQIRSDRRREILDGVILKANGFKGAIGNLFKTKNGTSESIFAKIKGKMTSPFKKKPKVKKKKEDLLRTKFYASVKKGFNGMKGLLTTTASFIGSGLVGAGKRVGGLMKGGLSKLGIKLPKVSLPKPLPKKVIIEGGYLDAIGTVSTIGVLGTVEDATYRKISKKQSKGTRRHLRNLGVKYNAPFKIKDVQEGDTGGGKDPKKGGTGDMIKKLLLIATAVLGGVGIGKWLVGGGLKGITNKFKKGKGIVEGTYSGVTGANETVTSNAVGQTTEAVGKGLYYKSKKTLMKSKTGAKIISKAGKAVHKGTMAVAGKGLTVIKDKALDVGKWLGGKVFNILSHPKMAKILGKHQKTILHICEEFAGKAGKKAMNMAAKKGARAGVTAIPAIGIFVEVGFAVVDFYTGWKTAHKIFGCNEKDVTHKMQFISGITQAVQGVVMSLLMKIPVFGWIASIGLGLLPIDWLIKKLYTLLGGDIVKDIAENKERRIKVEYKKVNTQWKKDHGTDMSKVDFKTRVNTKENFDKTKAFTKNATLDSYSKVVKTAMGSIAKHNAFLNKPSNNRIGYGTPINGLTQQYASGISKAEGYELMKDKLNDLSKKLAIQPWYSKLNSTQKAVVLEHMYTEDMDRPKGKFIRLMAKGKFDKASRYLSSKGRRSTNDNMYRDMSNMVIGLKGNKMIANMESTFNEVDDYLVTGKKSVGSFPTPVKNTEFNKWNTIRETASLNNNKTTITAANLENYKTQSSMYDDSRQIRALETLVSAVVDGNDKVANAVKDNPTPTVNVSTQTSSNDDNMGAIYASRDISVNDYTY